MPNYAGLADFLGPLRESMKMYNEGQKDKAMELAKQVETLMGAYESQERARYQSAQAYRTQALTEPEIAYKQAQAGAQERLGEYRGEQATTERETRPYDIEYARERPITEQGRQKLFGAQTGLAISKVATPTDLQTIVSNTPELKAILGDKESYTKAEIDAGLKVLRDRALNAKDAKMVEYYDARIDYTNKQSEVSDARIADIKAGGAGKPLTPYQQMAKLKVDAVNQLVEGGATLPQALNTIGKGLDPSEISMWIRNVDNALLMTFDENERRSLIAQKTILKGMLEQHIKPYQSEDIQKQVEETKSGKKVIPADVYLKSSTNEFYMHLLELASKGYKQVDVASPKGVIARYVYDSATRSWGMAEIPEAERPKPTTTQRQSTPKKEAPKPEQTTKKPTQTPTTQSNKDYQDAINFFKKNPMR